MASPVYSIRVFSVASQAAGTTTVYTVPAGKVMILRDVDGIENAAGATYGALEAGGSGAVFAFFPSSAASTIHQWRGRQVFGAGEELKLIVGAGGNLDLTGSGYLLDE